MDKHITMLLLLTIRVLQQQQLKEICRNSPSENTSILKKDINGNITTDINTAVVTPRAPAAGFISPGIKNFFGSGPGTGEVSVIILDPDSVRNLHTYRLEFEDSSKYHNNSFPYYSLIDYTEGDTLIYLKQIQGS